MMENKFEKFSIEFMKWMLFWLLFNFLFWLGGKVGLAFF